LLNSLWTSLIPSSWTKNGKLVENHKGETDTKQAVHSFLKEESYAIAPPKWDKAGKEAAHV
jgi:hypothetical protein